MLTATQKQQVLQFVQRLDSRTFTFRDVVRFLDLDSDDRRSLQRHLDELDDEGVIHRIKRGRYTLPAKEAMVSGILTCHRDGYGFVKPEDRAAILTTYSSPPATWKKPCTATAVLIKVAARKRVPRPGVATGL